MIERGLGDTFATWIAQLTSRYTFGANFILLQVKDWQYSFAVFEGLNNRGLDLSERDLVKNSVLAKAHGAIGISIEDAEKRWDTLANRVAVTKFKNFLRHYLLIFQEDVPTKTVVRKFNTHFQSKSAEKLLSEMEDAAGAYERISKPSVEKKPKLRDAFERLNALEAYRSFPIPLAGVLGEIPEKFLVRVLRSVEVLYFRHSLIMGQDNKVLEQKFQKVASALYHEGSAGVPFALKTLAEITPGDEEFSAMFIARRKPLRDKQARFMLVEMERVLHEGPLVGVDRSKATLEHVLPQSSGKWNLTPAQSATHEEDKGRLGNLTLLIQVDNSAIADKPFGEKLPVYLNQNLKINQGIIEETEWTIEQIEARQEQMAGWACKAFPIDIGSTQ